MGQSRIRIGVLIVVGLLLWTGLTAYSHLYENAVRILAWQTYRPPAA